MQLREYCERFIESRTLCQKYQGSLRCAVRELTEFVGGYLELESIEAWPINKWLALIEAESPVRASNKRRHIRALWAAAFDEGLAPAIGPLRRIKVPRKDPDALTKSEVVKLIAAAQKLEGCFKRTQTPRRIYWESLLNAYWDTALRISDLRSIERDWIWPGGYISIVQHKVNRSHQVKFRPQTIKLIDTLCDGRKTGLIWGVLNRRNFFNAQRDLFDRAGVRGSGKWIRRASASYVEKHRPGTGWRHLGHSRPGIAEIYYLDKKIVRPQPTLPPKLTG